MTTKTAIRRWSALDDNSAESLSGGRRGRYAPVVIYRNAPAPRAAAPAAAPAPAAPLQLFQTDFLPNPIAGGPAVQVRTPIPNEIGVTRFGSVVASGRIITTG
jgi:hypothetical protein